MRYAKAVTPSELRLAEVAKQFISEEFTLVLEAPVESKSLGLCGKVDAVAITSSEAVPIEIKLETSPEKVKRLATHHLVQVIAYAIAVEETFKKPVWRALIVSSEGGAAFEIRVGPVLRERVYRLVKELWRVVEEERLPRPTPSVRKCSACFYKKFCSRL
jgi:CRISPR-associated protein Cas4